MHAEFKFYFLFVYKDHDLLVLGSEYVVLLLFLYKVVVLRGVFCRAR